MDRRATGQNNGRIAQFSDSSTGEVVNYTYDALNRLIAATTSNNTGPVWGESYTYDGFGNLLSKVPTQGTAPQVYTGVNSSTNQMGPADANGNWLGSNSPQFAWDVENRMVFSGATDSASNWVTYSYDPWGKRVLQYASAGSASTVSTCVLYFYGANGKRLGTYNCGYSNGQFVVSTANINMYFGKKLFAAGSETNQNAVMTDRLGSVRGQNLSASIAYYPYGEERTSTPDNTDKFGTYFRDGFGQDYADQRYYTAVAGRFWSPDRGGTAKPGNPISWNRYAYASGDPANRYDPAGHDDEDAGCAAFDSSVCEALGENDPMNTGVMPPPDMVSVPCSAVYGLDFDPMAADCPMSYQQYDDLVEGPAGPAPRRTYRTYFLVVTTDCYDVPANGGPVTRDITYQLDFLEEGMPSPMFTNQGVIWEHLTGGLGSMTGADSPSSGPPGTFEDQQSIAGVGTGSQSGAQSFTVQLNNGVSYGLAIAAFGGTVSNPVPSLGIQKYAGYISINGNTGGQVSNGKLVPGTYTPCP
jgi:RHS repeat-associated protein